MTDLVLLLLTIGFFALCTLLVRACDGIIGPDPQDGETLVDPQDHDLEEVGR